MKYICRLTLESLRRSSKKSRQAKLFSCGNHKLRDHWEHAIFSELFSTAYERATRAGERESGYCLAEVNGFGGGLIRERTL
jgi:hypothetical protein